MLKIRYLLFSIDDTEWETEEKEKLDCINLKSSADVWLKLQGNIQEHGDIYAKNELVRAPQGGPSLSSLHFENKIQDFLTFKCNRFPNFIFT